MNGTVIMLVGLSEEDMAGDMAVGDICLGMAQLSIQGIEGKHRS